MLWFIWETSQRIQEEMTGTQAKTVAVGLAGNELFGDLLY
jgi:hypothetical protein